MIKLGDTVRDKLTGFSGIATARVEYLFNPPEIRVESTVLRDGKPVDGIWISEARITTED